MRLPSLPLVFNSVPSDYYRQHLLLDLLPSYECETSPNFSMKMTVEQEQEHTNKYKGEGSVVVFELSNSLPPAVVLLI